MQIFEDHTYDHLVDTAGVLNLGEHLSCRLDGWVDGRPSVLATWTFARRSVVDLLVATARGSGSQKAVHRVPVFTVS